MNASENAWGDLRGVAVIGGDGERLGEVIDVFSDQLTDQPEWIVVASDRHEEGRHQRLVPLVEAEIAETGLRVPYDLGQVASSPDVGGAGHLNVDDEAQLYVHYGLDPWEYGAKSGGRTGGTPTGVPLSPHSDGGPDASRAGGDGAVV